VNLQELKDRLAELHSRDLFEILCSVLDADEQRINELIEDLLDDLDLEEEAG
jgi:hypothetical protein